MIFSRPYASTIILSSMFFFAALEIGAGDKTGLVYHEDYLKHDTGSNHPERPERLTAIVDYLRQRGWLNHLTMIEPTPAALEWISLVHSPEYVAEVARSCEQGKSYLHSRDTAISRDSYAVARLAAGGVLSAIDAVMNGEVRNAFCVSRPPGHHASGNKAMGFCLFNNVAIGARYAQKRYDLAKVLIVDFDVHHGNGTQDIFYEDPSVFYFSIHRAPFYPGTGGADESGSEKGLGYTVNVPLLKGAGDQEYSRVFEKIFKPMALAFRPDFILISAGFDACEKDPLGGMKLTPGGYAAITETVRMVAEKCCAGRLVSVLEGGYCIKGLPLAVEAHISVLAGNKQSELFKEQKGR